MKTLKLLWLAVMMALAGCGNGTGPKAVDPWAIFWITNTLQNPPRSQRIYYLHVYFPNSGDPNPGVTGHGLISGEETCVSLQRGEYDGTPPDSNAVQIIAVADPDSLHATPDTLKSAVFSPFPSANPDTTKWAWRMTDTLLAVEQAPADWPPVETYPACSRP
jgi:hypothetical protein